MTRTDRRGTPALQGMLRVALALGLLGGVMYLNRAEIRTVLDRTPDVPRLAAGFALYCAGVALALVRWFVLARALRLPLPFIEAMRLGCVAHFFNLMIPGQVGGDVIKASYLCREDVKRGHAVASIVLNVVMNLMGLFLLAVVAGALDWRRLDLPERRLVGVAVAFLGGSVALLALGLSPVFYRARARRVAGSSRKSRRLAEFAEAAAAYRRRPGVLALALAMATATHVGNILAFAQVGRALFPTVPTLSEHFLMVPLILFSTAIPLPMGALGASEEISAQLFRLADYQGGFVTMMGYRLLQYSACLISGTVYLANRSRVRLLAASAEVSPEAEDSPTHPTKAPGEPHRGDTSSSTATRSTSA